MSRKIYGPAFANRLPNLGRDKISGMTLKHGDVEMKTVTLEVATLKDVKRRARDAFKGRKQGARISFATPELLFRLMTAKRWELIRTMTGAGPLTIREAARRVDRDVKGVHGDVRTLLNAGILQKTDDGLIIFPYDAIRIDVMLHAA
jgi:predicted transcriptional regulator